MQHRFSLSVAAVWTLLASIHCGASDEPQPASAPAASSSQPTATQPAPTRGQPRAIDLPGVRNDGRVQLPNQWSLRPTGRQTVVGDFPVSIAVHPGGKHVAVLHAGYGTHEVILLSLSDFSAAVRSRHTLDAAFYGLCWSADGRRLFCSGGPKERLEAFSFTEGELCNRQALDLLPPGSKASFVVSGVAAAADGQTLFACGNRGHEVAALPTAGGAAPVRVKLERDSFPYACVVDEARRKLYVSLWGKATVAVLDLPLREDSVPSATWPVEDHPNEMLLTRDGATLYVANANRNTVSAIDAATGRTREVIGSALYPNAPNGSTPNSIAISPDEKTLFIANADNNNIAVIDVSHPGAARSKGFIPVGWYPTSVRVTPDGERLLVANGKGTTPKANRGGPNPLRRGTTIQEYIGGLYRGTLSVIKMPDDDELKKLSASAYRCSPLREDQRPVLERPEGNPIPARVGEPSPIRHVIYIIKENRTYDQVLGDMPEGNGDAGLCIFGEKVTPNQHALAREFVLLDNFYVEAEVSADGHEWSMAAYATDFVEKNWPLDYGGKGFGKIGYPSEGAFRIAAPTVGYIWDRCAAAGVSYLTFGEFVERKDGVNSAKLDVLRCCFDPEYEPYDMDVSDQKRADRFIARLNEFEAAGEMPRFITLHLPRDHTAGTQAGKPTPTAMVADNDLALGRIVESVCRSKFWPQTAIFVIEDDAQNGSDHVDAHRTIAFVVSPHARRGAVDSSLYSTTSMLRTMELILGLPPMSQFDAAARPMYASFAAQPDVRPFSHRPAQVNLAATNAANAWGAELSARMDFSKEDAADDLLLNDIVWRSVRGPDSPMPAPVRAAFVLRVESHDDDD